MHRSRIGRRIMLGAIGLGFGVGCFTHAVDFWTFGFAPYAFGPAVLNLFWNMLVALDAAVIVLLLAGRVRPALALGLAIMIGDVAANSYAWGALGLTNFAPPLVAQTGFLGYLIGSLPFLWPRGSPTKGYGRATDPDAAARLPDAAGDGARALP